MNDDFLHRPRKAPSPEFLASLKARLDRQPKLARPRRSGFVRGMLVGFLVAGVAFAVTSLSLTGVPTSAGQFFSAPVEYVARMLFHTHTTEQDADRSQIKVVPLGPAWYPTYVDPRRASGSQDFKNAPSSDSAAYVGPQTAPTGAVAALSSAILIGAPRELVPFAEASAPAYVLRTPTKISTKVIEQSDQAAFSNLCRSSAVTDDHRIDIIEVGHRITAEQLRSCTYSGSTHETEILVGYQAVVLARSKLYGPLSLTARDLFLALARRVPDPEHPDTLIDNPYTAWNQIDPALPYDKIHFIGPISESPEGQLAAAMLLEAGCNTFPSLVALREHDAYTFDSVCRSLRNDSAYAESAVSGGFAGFVQINDLNTLPTAFGIFTLQGLTPWQDKVAVNPIDGVTPDHTTIAAHSYPASRPLYLYVYPWGIDGYAVRQTAVSMVNWGFSNTTMGATTWGFVPPDAAEQAARREILSKFW